MNGDLAPLVEITDLAERHQVMLMVDEAHATGVFGATGRGRGGISGRQPAHRHPNWTLSKALGGVGGFVCGQKNLIDWLVNRARGYIFSTALPAAACAAASAALRIVREEPQRRVELLARAERLARRARHTRLGRRSLGQPGPFRLWSASRNERSSWRGHWRRAASTCGHSPPQRRAGPGPAAHRALVSA